MGQIHDPNAVLIVAAIDRLTAAIVAQTAATDHGDSPQTDRIIRVQERIADSHDEHVQWHRRQGYPEIEPKA